MSDNNYYSQIPTMPEGSEEQPRFFARLKKRPKKIKLDKKPSFKIVTFILAFALIGGYLILSTFAADNKLANPQTYEGQVDVFHFNKGEEDLYAYTLKTKQGTFEVDFRQSGEHSRKPIFDGTVDVETLVSGDTIRITGKKDKNHITVDLITDSQRQKNIKRLKAVKSKSLDPKSIAKPGTAQAANNSRSQVLGARSDSATVIIVDFDSKRNELTRTQVSNIMTDNKGSVNNYFLQQSYDQLGIGLSSILRVTIPKSSGYCPTDNGDGTASAQGLYNWEAKVNDTLAKSGYTLNTRHRIYSFPLFCNGIPAAAQVGGPVGRVWTFYIQNQFGGLENAFLNNFLIGHELGHAYSLAHAHSISCYGPDGSRIAIGAQGSIYSGTGFCAKDEYGDPFTTMGRWGNVMHYSSDSKAYLGWIPGINQTFINGPGSYRQTLYPQSIPAYKIPVYGGLQRIVIRRDPTSNFRYEVELRQNRYPSGFEDDYVDDDPVMSGASIRFGEYSSGNYLVDTTPGTASFKDAPLTKGRTFYDFRYGISITATNVQTLYSPSYVELQVRVAQYPLYRYNGSSDTSYDLVRQDAGYAAYGYSYGGCEAYVWGDTNDGRVPLYRYYSRSASDHFFTVERNDSLLAYYGYAFENISVGTVYHYNRAKTYTVESGFPDTVTAIAGAYDVTPTSLRAANNISSGTEKLPIGTRLTVPPAGTTPLIRYYSSTKGDHLYSTIRDDALAAALGGYRFERIEAYVLAPPANRCKP